MFIILLHVFLHTFQNGHGVRLNTGITGGSFQHNKNMDSHVVLANSGVGPRMCVEDWVESDFKAIQSSYTCKCVCVFVIPVSSQTSR
jgi:hypothetical protein